MKYVDLESHLQSNDLFPAYVIGGDDAYLKRLALNAFKGLISKDFSDFNLSFSQYGDGLAETVSTLMTYPVFDDKKVVVLQNAPDEFSEEDKSILNDYLKEPNPTSVLVIVNDGKKAKSMLKKAEYVDCAKLNDEEVKIVVDRLLSTPPVATMDAKAIRALSERTQYEAARIVGEINKLKAFCQNGNITLADVIELVEPDLDFALYELTGAVSEKMGDKALNILNTFEKQGVEKSMLISMLYTQYARMLQAELHKNDVEADLCQLMEVSSGQLYHIKRVSKNYTQVRLKNAADYLHNLQFAIRQGKMTDETALHEAILTLLNI